MTAACTAANLLNDDSRGRRLATATRHYSALNWQYGRTAQERVGTGLDDSGWKANGWQPKQAEISEVDG